MANAARARRLAALALGAGAVLLLCVAVEQNFISSLRRATSLYILPAWSEGPLLLELRRMAVGEPAYTPPTLVNAYDYGPVYDIAVNTLRAAFGLEPSVVVLRHISMALGLLSVVPLAFATWFVATRAGLRGMPLRVAVTFGALLGVADLARNITFEFLHPDNMLFLLIASALAFYYGIAAGRLSPQYAWAIVAFCVAAAFTKQNSVVVAVVLLCGLTLGGRLDRRLLTGTVAATLAAIAACVVAMPPAMRAWSVQVPLAHRYQPILGRLADLGVAFVHEEPFVGASVLLGLPALWLLSRHAGRRTLWIDGVAAAAIAITAFAAFFKELGTSNNIALSAAWAAPYAGVVVGALVAAVAAGRRPFAAAAGLLAIAAILAHALRDYSGDQHPPLARGDARDARRMQVLVDDLCASGGTIMVVEVFPDFFRCRSAQFAVPGSLTELQLAYPRYDPGATIFDRPIAARYVVAPEGLDLPDAWAATYHAVHPEITLAGPGRRRLHIGIYERTGPVAR